MLTQNSSLATIISDSYQEEVFPIRYTQDFSHRLKGFKKADTGSKISNIHFF